MPAHPAGFNAQHRQNAIVAADWVHDPAAFTWENTHGLRPRSEDAECRRSPVDTRDSTGNLLRNRLKTYEIN
jgi:hypothetical protein